DRYGLYREPFGSSPLRAWRARAPEPAFRASGGRNRSYDALDSRRDEGCRNRGAREGGGHRNVQPPPDWLRSCYQTIWRSDAYRFAARAAISAVRGGAQRRSPRAPTIPRADRG